MDETCDGVTYSSRKENDLFVVMHNAELTKNKGAIPELNGLKVAAL